MSQDRLPLQRAGRTKKILAAQKRRAKRRAFFNTLTLEQLTVQLEGQRTFYRWWSQEFNKEFRDHVTEIMTIVWYRSAIRTKLQQSQEVY